MVDNYRMNLHTVQLTALPPDHLLHQQNPESVLLSWCQLTEVVPERRLLNEYLCSMSIYPLKLYQSFLPDTIHYALLGHTLLFHSICLHHTVLYAISIN